MKQEDEEAALGNSSHKGTTAISAISQFAVPSMKSLLHYASS